MPVLGVSVLAVEAILLILAAMRIRPVVPRVYSGALDAVAPAG